ncbi:MAG: GTP-binding protein [Verrucomicrobiae bacterium]|nr:GTP-binding protein [Verrucomicrobiae bacterium]
MIPLSLITGFLGSGKTTFLKHLVRRYRGRKIVFLVNEYADVDVDGVLMGQESRDVVPIPGGSIFCRCLAGEFIRHLKELPLRFGTPDAPVTGVVVEASGMADPRVAGRMLEETGLGGTFSVATSVVVVDPGSFLKLLNTLPSVKAQVEAADLALVNKMDLYSPERMAETETALKKINPKLVSVRTCRCETDSDVFVLPAGLPKAGETAVKADPQYMDLVAAVPGEFDFVRFAEAVERLRGQVFRIKGFVRIGGELRHVDYTSSGFDLCPMDIPAATELVFILRGRDSAAAQELVKRVQDGGFARH